MESILHHFGNLDMFPVFVNLTHTITQPFVHSFQAVIPGFLPTMKSLFSNEPGLFAGMIFVLFSYSFIVMVQKTKSARVLVTNEKPSSIYKEGFPAGLNSEKRL